MSNGDTTNREFRSRALRTTAAGIASAILFVSLIGWVIRQPAWGPFGDIRWSDQPLLTLVLTVTFFTTLLAVPRSLALACAARFWQKNRARSGARQLAVVSLIATVFAAVGVVISVRADISIWMDEAPVPAATRTIFAGMILQWVAVSSGLMTAIVATELAQQADTGGNMLLAARIVSTMAFVVLTMAFFVDGAIGRVISMIRMILTV